MTAEQFFRLHPGRPAEAAQPFQSCDCPAPDVRPITGRGRIRAGSVGAGDGRIWLQSTGGCGSISSDKTDPAGS